MKEEYMKKEKFRVSSYEGGKNSEFYRIKNVHKNGTKSTIGNVSAKKIDWIKAWQSIRKDSAENNHKMMLKSSLTRLIAKYKQINQ